MNPGARIWRFLRSRKVALWLLFACTLWSIVGTLYFDPGTPTGLPALVAENPALARAGEALGLKSAFTNPVFLFLVAWLALSTAACAWERTAGAVRALRAAAEGVSDSTIRALERSPLAAFDCPGPAGLDAAKRELRDMRLEVRATPRVVRARAGRSGVLGSPIFHWSLVGLFVVVALGQLTRFEGIIGIPVGDGAPYAVGSFPKGQAGPLYVQRYGDLRLRVDDLLLDYKTGSVERGEVPVVSLVRGDEVVAKRAVYDNHPLRYGALLVHQGEYGISPQVTLLAADGTEVTTQRGIIDFPGKSGTKDYTPYALLVSGEDAAVRAVEVTLTVAPPESDKPVKVEDARVRVAVFDPLSGESTVTVLSPGESVGVRDRMLRYDAMGYYARLTVADDWSVYPIYLLFFTAVAGLALTMFVPARTAWVMYAVDDEGTGSLRVLVRNHRSDPVFAERVVAAAARAAVEAGGQGVPSQRADGTSDAPEQASDRSRGDDNEGS